MADEALGESSTVFLEKVEKAEVSAVVSPMVLDEVLYKLIVSKAAEKLDTDQLWRIREKIRDQGFAKECYSAALEFKNYVKTLKGLHVADVKEEDFENSVDIGREHGLLTMDAFHVAVMKRLNMKHIATNDADFERVDFLKVWKP